MRLLLGFAIVLTVTPLLAQQESTSHINNAVLIAPVLDAELQSAGQTTSPSDQGQNVQGGQNLPDSPDKAKSQPQIPLSKQQPKRILCIMPNFRAVSAGAIPPPPTPKQAFKIATQNSFDYSSFIFVGITSLLAEGTDAHPALGKGASGYWGYYWRGFVDKTDGNYFVIFVMPTILHQDVRYYAKGEGNIFKRGIYAGSRVLITPDYHGHDTFNASEIVGRGIAQAISISYYPSKDRTAADIAEKYGYAIGARRAHNGISRILARHRCACASSTSLRSVLECKFAWALV